MEESRADLEESLEPDGLEMDVQKEVVDGQNEEVDVLKEGVDVQNEEVDVQKKEVQKEEVDMLKLEAAEAGMVMGEAVEGRSHNDQGGRGTQQRFRSFPGKGVQPQSMRNAT